MNEHLPIELLSHLSEIKHNDLSFEVISCVQAANAKKIPLKNEVKSLVLNTSNGQYVAHIPGDKKLQHRHIKNILCCNEASLASPKDLHDMNLSPGTVCAIQNPVWQLTHLISKELLDLEYISTNDGTRTGYYIFSPKLLLLSKKNITGIFTGS